MAVYKDGKRRQEPAAAETDASLNSLLEKLKESSGNVGDTGRFTEAEMAYLQAAMGRLADEHLGEIRGADPLSGKQMDKVFEREDGQ